MPKFDLSMIKKIIHYLTVDEEEEELKNYIPKEVFDNFNNNGIAGLTLIFRLNAVVMPCWLIMETIYKDESELFRSWVGIGMLFFGALIWLYLLKFHKDKFKLILPINIVLYCFVATYMSWGFKDYRIVEYYLPCIAFVCWMSATAPTQLKLNATAFTWVIILADYLLTSSYPSVPIELHVAFLWAIIFFNWFVYVMNTNVKVLFAMLLKNEKLIREITKIIQAFPHAVLIQSTGKWFTNREFDLKIREIDCRFNRLKKVHVKVEKDDEFAGEIGEAGISNSHIVNLKQLLKRQVARLEFEDVIEQDSVFMRVKEVIKHHSADNFNLRANRSSKRLMNPTEENNGSESYESDVEEDFPDIEALEGRYCNIKSMRVLWKGIPSFMHVFIDTTNIMKLEEANNNIKCQKIMFASASHEF
jgi:hypothetical protein